MIFLKAWLFFLKMWLLLFIELYVCCNRLIINRSFCLCKTFLKMWLFAPKTWLLPILKTWLFLKMWLFSLKTWLFEHLNPLFTTVYELLKQEVKQVCIKNNYKDCSMKFMLQKEKRKGDLC